MTKITTLRKIKFIGSKNPQAFDIAISVGPVENIQNQELTFFKDEARMVTSELADYLLKSEKYEFKEIFED